MNVKANVKPRAVALLRVSTCRQGRSGLGLEAQRRAIQGHLADNWEIVEWVEEVESGRRADRPQLRHALRLCRSHSATLAISRLDRLTRDPHFLFELERAGVPFLVVDAPFANQFSLRIMAIMAAEEARWVSERTKAALASRRARGLSVGGNNPRIGEFAQAGAGKSAAVRAARARTRAQDLEPVLQTLRAEGAQSLAALARGLNERGIPAPRGGLWHAQSVRQLVQRLEG